jgi:hypothetical protein
MLYPIELGVRKRSLTQVYKFWFGRQGLLVGQSVTITGNNVIECRFIGRSCAAKALY